MDTITDTTSEQSTEEISLLESLNQEWHKLPTAVMRDCGSAALTYAGLLRITNKQTFIETKTIAEKARVPLATARKHLELLRAAGYVKHEGRQVTRSGYPRRTVTRTIKVPAGDYGILPWWAYFRFRRGTPMTWSEKAVLSVLMARLCGLKAVAERGGAPVTDDDDIVGVIENLGGIERFRFTVPALRQQTGLWNEAIVSAKKRLCGRGVISRELLVDGQGGYLGDLLIPNWDFRAVVTPASPGRCFVELRG